MTGLDSIPSPQTGILDPGFIHAPASVLGLSFQNAAGVFTALKPTFCPIEPRCSQFQMEACQVYNGTAIAASTVGFAVYSWVKTGAATYLATLVPNSAGTISTATGTGRKRGTLSPVAQLDFTEYRYVLGIMLSVATIGLALDGTDTIHQSLLWTAAALASTAVGSWPATFTQASAPANTGNLPAAVIVSTSGLGLT